MATYYERHREERLAYYHNNREKYRAKANELHNCMCGGRFQRSNKNRHLRSIKHKTYLSMIENDIKKIGLENQTN
jgi:hypothetical protein